MKGSATRQRCTLAEAPPQVIDAKLRCVTVMVFEESGKTIVQPLATDQEIPTLQELFKNGTLEVWLPNGKTDQAQFDVAILKYKQLMQPPTMCSLTKSRVCLKNHFDTIVSCEQCPLSEKGAKD